MTTATAKPPASNTTPNTPVTGNRPASQATSENADKFLSFCLGKEEYAIGILAVREIIGIIDITPLPQTPAFVKGVINLRGKIIPVIELRTKFSLPSVKYTEETCVIVVEVGLPENGDTFQMGVIVDNVREVLNISRSDIEPAPSFGCSIPLEFIMGMGKVKDKVVILLNINEVIATSDLTQVASATATAQNSTRDH